jgi:hypothetical protein
VSESEIRFQGNGRFDLEHWSGDPNGVLAFTNEGTRRCDDRDGMEFAGGSSSWTGLIYAPNGGVRVSGAGVETFVGSLVANAINVEGDGYQFDVMPEAVGPPKVRLTCQPVAGAACP